MRINSSIVLNEAPPVAGASFQRLTCNFLPTKVRNESLEGRPHLVVPMVILTKGVHAGSQGPILYNEEELSKTPVVWNHKPIVVYHPEMNGEGISACDPVIINNRKIGVMMNTIYDKGRLRSEAWIEEDRANRVDERIMKAVTANEMMEVSTGVFVDMEKEEGDWNGEKYHAIARNFRPDHLALLPDRVGACSIADGAGFLRNESNKKNPIPAAFHQFLVSIGLLRNEMSFENINQALCAALVEKYNLPPDGSKGYVWVTNVYSNFVIYSYDGKLFRLSYSATDTEVTLGDEQPKEVVRVTEYRTVDGAFVGNRDHTETTNEGTSMKKKELVDSIVANACGWSESDRAKLMEFTEEQLQVVANGSKKASTPAPAVPATSAPVTPAPAPATPTPPAPALQQAPEPRKVVTMQEYVENAPPEIRDVLNSSIELHNQEKENLTSAILANKNNSFTKEELVSRPLGELRRMARLAAVEPTVMRAPNYSGQAPAPTGNAAAEEALDLPVMNFAAAK